MRGLAEYAMSGRRQAILVAVLFGLIPYLFPLSAAIVALVVLRRGLHEGFIVLLWALLSAGLYWLGGGTSPVIVLIGTTLLAWLLRSTQSWQKVLVAATILGFVLQLSLPLQTDFLAQFEAAMEEAINQSQAAGQPLQIPQDGQMVAATPEQVVAMIMRYYGALHALLLIVSLMIARAWQARLYNPGGFGQEFHNLRLDPRLMALLLALIIGGMYGVSPLADSLTLFYVVPFVLGLALTHAVVARLKLNSIWLVVGDLVLLMMGLIMMPLIVMLVFVDSVIDIRKRLKNNPDLPKD